MSAFTSLDIVYMLGALFAYLYFESQFECGFLVTVALSAFLMRSVNFPIAIAFLALNLLGHLIRHDMLIFFSFMSLCSMILFRKRKCKEEEQEIKVAVIDEVIEGKRIASPVKTSTVEVSSNITKEIVVEHEESEEVTTIEATLTTIEEVVVTSEPLSTEEDEPKETEENIDVDTEEKEKEEEEEAHHTPVKTTRGRKAAKTPATKEKKKTHAEISVAEAIKQAQEEQRLRMEERLKQLEEKKPKKK